MRKSTITPIAVAATCLIVSCQKIPEPTQIEANLKTTPAQFTDAVPASYGQLVSVTQAADPYGAVMWFKKPDDTIVIVRINYSRGALGPNIIEVPRK
jgi:hypothetical protein